MSNMVMIIGRLVEKPILNEEGNTNITLAVNRNYKNNEGIYETDFFNILITGSIAENVIEYCNKGDIVGIKGRLETKITTDDEGLASKTIEIIAEKVTFLSSRKKEDEEVI